MNVKKQTQQTQDIEPLRSINELCDPQDIRKVFKTGRMIEKEKIAGSAGGQLSIRLTICPIIDKPGKVHRVSVIAQDITELKMLESQVRHSNRMTSLGKLVATVAHEVGNPLNSIRTRLTRLKHNQSPDFIQKSLTILDTQLDRISRIVQGLSDYGANRPVKWELLDINALLLYLIGLIKEEYGTSIEVITFFAEELPKTFCVRDQILQVFWNLLKNSYKAIDHNGTIKVITETAGENIIVIIHNDGPGIDEKDLGKIFDPFFTTRKDGLGLGLAISRNFINAHNGEIMITNKKQGGVEARLSLPILTGKAN